MTTKEGSLNDTIDTEIKVNTGTDGSMDHAHENQLPPMILAEASHGAGTATSLILLMTVAAGGLALGNVKIRGVGLGSAGVLFCGLAVGGLGFKLDPSVLEFLREFGLMLSLIHI